MKVPRKLLNQFHIKRVHAMTTILALKRPVMNLRYVSDKIKIIWYLSMSIDFQQILATKQKSHKTQKESLRRWLKNKTNPRFNFRLIFSCMLALPQVRLPQDGRGLWLIKSASDYLLLEFSLRSVKNQMFLNFRLLNRLNTAFHVDYPGWKTKHCVVCKKSKIYLQ